MKQIFFVIASIAVTMFIFSNSAKVAEVSTVQSNVFVNLIMEFAQNFGIDISRGAIEHTVRKSAHIFEFCLQGFFLFGCFSCAPKKRFLFVFILGLATACTDECIQLFFDGRAGMIRDVFIDLTGTLLGFFIACLPIVKRFLPGKDVS